MISSKFTILLHFLLEMIAVDELKFYFSKINENQS